MLALAVGLSAVEDTEDAHSPFGVIQLNDDSPVANPEAIFIFSSSQFNQVSLPCLREALYGHINPISRGTVETSHVR